MEEERRGPVARMFEWAELPALDDIYTWKGTTKWGNHDLYPIDPKERTYGWLGFFAIWVTNGVSISTITLGSSYVAYGLTAGQTIGCILLGTCISSAIAFLAARPGMDYHVGYTVMNRPAYGLRGTYVPILVIVVAGLVFSGIQAYFGGLAVVIVLSAVIPGFHNMPNTLPASAAITTQDLIGLIIYTIIYLPILWFVPPHQIRKCLYPSFIFITATFIGIVAWIVHENGGTGSFISSPIVLTTSQRAFRMVQCISSVSGTWGGAAERISDWTRFERKRGSANPGMMFALPVSVTLVALIGVVIATATTEKYGTAVWNPLILLTMVQETTYTPLCRAATFFAGCGLLSSQIFINMSQNTIPYGMDVSALLPRYLSMKRAAVLVTLATLVVNPWRFLSQAAIFITILSCVTVFFASSTAIVLADFWIIRRKIWKVPDLYEPTGIYWFTGGWNFRCLTALILGMLPALPGFFMTCINVTADNAAVRIFQISYFVCCPLALIIYISLNYFWPVQGLGVQEFIREEDMPRIDGVIEGVDETTGEKQAGVREVSLGSSIKEDMSV